MFNNISWEGYWLAIALLTTGYYLSVYLLYFRNDFQVLFRGKTTEEDKNSYRLGGLSSIRHEARTNPSFKEDSEEFQTPEENSEEAIVYACIDELDAFFNESKKRKCVKEEMISSLQLIFKKYPSLKTSAYKGSLTNVFVGQCEHICSIHLNADDVVKVWFGS